MVFEIRENLFQKYHVRKRAMNNQLVAYKNSRIILSHERMHKAVLDIYPTNHLLTYVREGMLIVEQENEKQHFVKGEYVLFKKFTRATITKTWCEQSSKFSSIVFTFHEDLVLEALLQLNIPFDNNAKTSFKSIFSVEPNPMLDQFIHSLQMFFKDNVEMDAQIARLKTLELVIAILKSNNKLVSQLQDFSVRSKADLHQFMQHHYLQNKSLEDFAKESGRSLSTFKRDFQALYHTPPRKWLKQKRLDHAYQLIISTSKTASDIYLECGFEDLAHFSKSFKQQFGLNPSQLNMARTDK